SKAVCCRMETALSARRPCAGAVPGRWGACLAVRTPPATFFRGSQVSSQPSPRPHAVGHFFLVRAREDRAPPTRLPSEITVRDDLAAGPGHQPGEDPDVDGGLQEMHGAVCKHRVGPVGVEAIDLPVIRAIDGAGPEEPGSVPCGTPAPHQAPRGP